jgi:hypothetical protein
MKITFKGFGKGKVEIDSNYRVCGTVMNRELFNHQNAQSSTKRDTNVLKALWDLYLVDETTFAIVQSISLICLGSKFAVEDVKESSEDYKKWRKFFTRAWPSLYGIVRDTLIFGNSFSKVVQNRVGEPYNLEILFPLDVTKIVTNKKTTYLYQGKTYKDEEIFENYFFPRADSDYAISLLAPIKSALDRKRGMDSSITTTLNRHLPRFHISCKSDSMGRYPDEAQREEIGREFKKLSSDTEFVSSDLIDIDVIDTRASIPDIDNYQMYFLNSALMGALVSPEIIGVQTGSGSFATAKSRMNAFLTFIIPFYQHMLEYNIKNQLMMETDAMLNILPPTELAMPWSKALEEEEEDNVVEKQL